MWNKILSWFQKVKILSFLEAHEKIVLGPLIIIYVGLYFLLPAWSDNFFIIAGAGFWLFLIYSNQTVKAKIKANTIGVTTPQSSTPITPA
jgi:hypothetical protein